MLLSNEECDEELDALCAGRPTTAMAGPTPVSALGDRLKTLIEVRQGLKTAGFSPFAILALVKTILDLIAVLGPKVQEIIDEIKRHLKPA